MSCTQATHPAAGACQQTAPATTAPYSVKPSVPTRHSTRVMYMLLSSGECQAHRANSSHLQVEARLPAQHLLRQLGACPHSLSITLAAVHDLQAGGSACCSSCQQQAVTLQPGMRVCCASGEAHGHCREHAWVLGSVLPPGCAPKHSEWRSPFPLVLQLTPDSQADGQADSKGSLW